MEKLFKTAEDFGGFWLKGVKTYPGHEGEPCAYGSIALNGKKVGTFKDDAWGGPMDVEFTNKDAEDAFFALAKQRYPDFEHEVEASLICDLLTAFDTIAHFKRKRRCCFVLKKELSMWRNTGTYRTMIHPYKGHEKGITDYLTKQYGAGEFIIIDKVIASL